MTQVLSTEEYWQILKERYGCLVRSIFGKNSPVYPEGLHRNLFHYLARLHLNTTVDRGITQKNGSFIKLLSSWQITSLRRLTPSGGINSN